MDPEKTKRRQSLKVIISETIMIITVILTVAILAFLVSGYWINSEFKVERQGLLQISSIPTGADVYIDDEDASWLQRTNTSKVLASGEHTVTLTKDGYDSWTKTINISEGLLYRIHYPRLFLKDRTKQTVLDVANYTAATISPDHNYLLLINNTTEWNLVNLDSEKIEATKVDISKLFSSANSTESSENNFTGEIIKINWDYDSNHTLIEAKSGDSIEWVLLDVKNIKNSINLTKEFGGDFTEIQILDNSSNNLLAVQNGNLRKISIPDKSISSVLVENITNFDHYNNTEVVFSTDTYVGILKIGNDKITKLQEIPTPAKVTLSKFYDDKYITILQNNLVSLYYKDIFTKIADFELSFTPDHMEVCHNGEFITMYYYSKIATLDMESTSIREWLVDGNTFGWIDNDMIYTVADEQLIVYDYDGLNRRILADSATNHFPAAITSDKWLYYFSNNNLIREGLTN